MMTLPGHVRTVMRCLAARILKRRKQQCALKIQRMGELMRVDAKADDMMVCVGGWLPIADGDGVVQTRLSPWFSIPLTEQNAPWAFFKGKPFKVVAALELLASTIGLVLLYPDARCTDKGVGTVRV